MKLPGTLMVAPEVTVAVWHGGSVHPMTWLKQTVYGEPDAGTSSQTKPQWSAMYVAPDADLSVIWLATPGLVVTRSNPAPLCPTQVPQAVKLPVTVIPEAVRVMF